MRVRSLAPPARRSEGSRLFRRWGTFVVRHRWWCLAANLLVTAWMAWQTRDLVFDTSFRALMVSDSESVRVLEKLHDHFGRDDLFQVVIEGDVFSMKFLERLKALHDDLAALDVELETLGVRDRRNADGSIAQAVDERAAAGEFENFADDEGWGDEGGGSIVDEIVSLINVRDTSWRDDALRVGGLMDDWPPREADLPHLRSRALSRKTIADQIVSRGGRYTVIYIRTDFMLMDDVVRTHAAIERICDAHAAPGFKVLLTGPPAMGAVMHRILMRDLEVMNGLSILAMLLILGFTFRHWLGVAGPLLVVIQSVLWTTGIMSSLGVAMTMVSTIIPAFLICVGIGDSVHIQSVYRQARARGETNEAAIVHAIEYTGTPVLFTTLTTAVGLISFRLASLDAIREFGTFGALGVMVALAETLLFLPVLLTFNRTGTFGGRVQPDGDAPRGPVTRLLGFCDALSRRRVSVATLDDHSADPVLGEDTPVRVDDRPRRRVLVGTVVFASICAIGASMTEVRHNPLTWIPADNPGRVAVLQMDEHLGGAVDFTLLIEAKEGRDLRDRELMLALEKLENHMQAYRDPGGRGRVVRTSAGILDLVKETWWSLHAQQDARYEVPDTQQGVVDTFTMFESSSPSRLRRLLTVDSRTALMIVRVNWMDDHAYRPLVAHIQKGVQEYIGDRARVSPTGAVYESVTSGAAIVSDLLKSFGLALVVITVLMIFLLDDIRLGLIAMVPNILPIGATLAFMGFVGMPIDMSNLLIASIGISIAVDDTIHFLHQFQAHYETHGNVDRAVANSFERAGHAMVHTSLILFAGFLVFVASTLLNFQNFGMLIALTVSLALFIDLIFTPALVRTFFRDRPPSSAM